MSPRTPPTPSPSPVALRQALRKITEILAAELARPSLTPPNWSDHEWMLAQAVAAMHGVSPLLARTLRWRGPAAWVTFIEAQRAHTEHRHLRVLELLRSLDNHLREQGIGAVALKGVALHAIGLYAAGERPMADVDLLVRPQHAQRAAGMIESLGFYEYCASWKERAFTRIDGHLAGELGEHADNDIKIELHERICERLPLRITDMSDAIFPASPEPGLNAYPSTAALMTHLLLHAAGAMAFQSLRLLHLHDLALLSARMTGSDWEQLLENRAPDRPMHWALPPLQLTARYYPLHIPANVLAALRADCPALLRQLSQRRRLSDVSYSYPWVDAFPGIEWSRSVHDMAQFVVSRVRPGAQHLALRETTVLTQSWASGAAWSSMSQMHRIARWITSRPLRPCTMHAVNAARARMP
jgi:Uncharacterised nucleotidyltransferase